MGSARATDGDAQAFRPWGKDACELDGKPLPACIRAGLLDISIPFSRPSAPEMEYYIAGV